MRIEFAPPPPRLSAFVSVFYRLRSGQGEIAGLERAGRGHIRCQLKGRIEHHGPAGQVDAHSELQLCGPRMHARHWRFSRATDLFGFTLSPLGWARIVALPADQCTDRYLDGHSIFNGQGGRLLQDLRKTRDTAAMVDLSCAFIDARLAECGVPPDHARLIDSVEQWLEQGEGVAIEEMFAAQPWSPRQTTRLVNHYFGGPPKLLQRRARAQRATMAILNGAKPADMVAAFYDQPHMINEIKAFSGCTPGTLMRGLSPLSMASLSGRLCGLQPHANDQ